MQSKRNILETLKERVLILDGAMGTTLHAFDLPLSDYNGLENCNEILVITRPEVIGSIHEEYLKAGSDAVLTNTFGGSRLVLEDFGLGDRTEEINRKAAQIAREACDKHTTPDKPRYVIGSIGPGSRLPSLGQISWDELLASFLPQASNLITGGVDALLIETCQDILQTKCAVVACIDAMESAGVDIPIFCSITVETTGTMLVGTETMAALVALEAYPQVKAIGMNCATGPKEMSEHIRLLSQHCPRTIIVQPNAGLPELVDGETRFPLTPEELAEWITEFVEEDGVGIVGGCCGTTPAHIKSVSEAIGKRKPKPRNPKLEPSCSSIYQAVTLRQDNSVLAVGERTNANGSKAFRELLSSEDIDGMVQLGRNLVQGGSHVLDICTALVGRDEQKDMTGVVKRFVTDITAPLMIDSTDPVVIEEALKLCGGKSIINSINLEDGEEKLDQVCRLAKRYGAALVALTIDEEGMAKTTDRKVEIAKRIHNLVVNRHGILPSNLIFDTLTFTLATGNDEDRNLAVESLNAIKLIKETLPGVHTMLGLSNVSFGLKPPARKILNSVFLHYARETGLDAAIIHPTNIVPLFKIEEKQRRAAEDLIFNRKTDDYDPLKELLELFENHSAASEEIKAQPHKVEDRLKRRVIDGNRVGLEDDLTEALATSTALDIINDILLDGMKTVGDLFGSGQMQLPFVLQSAETMKASVNFLEPYIDKTEDEFKGTVVLATVRGDVHDIGKNLVDIILTNNGYKVINLGIKQPISAIAEAWEKHNADAIGMSGLLVKSTVVMRENVAVLNEREANPPVILGGAALTRKFVEETINSEYEGEALYAKDAFEGLHIMDRIMAGAIAPKKAAQAPAISKPPVPINLPTPARSTIAHDVPIPKPPFWGAKLIKHVPLKSILPYLNKKMLFNIQWQYHKGGMQGPEYDRFIETEVEPIFQNLAQKCEEENILQPQALYGYWPCQAEGDALVIYEPDNHDKELCRFDFPRQRKEPFWCLSDFFRPMESREIDVVGFHIVTIGHKATEICKQWYQQDQYRDYLHLHGLSVETAEALAEYVHKLVRTELGIAEKDDPDISRLLRQKYQGSRYSFGYPACPRLEDQLKLWKITDPSRVGVSLTEGFQLQPEQTTTAMICHHPEAKYFNVG